MLCFFLHRAPEAIKESTLEAIGFAATYNNGFRAFLKRHVQLFVNVDTFIRVTSLEQLSVAEFNGE